MTNRIVPIPWQPDLFARQSVVDRLIVASRYAGHNIEILPPDGALRSFARQLKYWLLWLARKGPVASNPRTGPRFHMRGAALDIKYVTATNRSAMLRAGFIPDYIEDWHFNDPNWASIPIVLVSPTSARYTLITEQEKDMQLLQITEKGNPLYTFDGHTAVPVPEGQGGMFKALCGKPTKISRATLNAAVAQGSRHVAARAA